jgi:ACS family hexuronate transporter-like MFS transporter
MPAPLAAMSVPEAAPDRRRWWLCALLVLAATLNYLDRQVLAILSATPEFSAVTGFGPIEYGYAQSVFLGAYAVGLPLAGRLVDRLGARAGYILVMAVWSVADMAHALARGPIGFFVARASLGLGEAGNFPAAIKATAETFPPHERGLATGLLNAGTSLGAVAAPLLIPWLYQVAGWRGVFVATGLLGFAWIAAWVRLAPRPAGAAAPRPVRGKGGAISWRELLRQRNAWAILLAKLLTDPIWFFYLAWLPRYLAERHGIDLVTLGLPLASIYLLSDVGSVAGGWTSGWLIRRGWPPLEARRLVMLGCALLASSAFVTAGAQDLWSVVLLVGLGTAAHQAWSANVFCLPADLFPPSVVGRVTGLAGMAGSLGGMVFSAVTGHLVAAAGGYRILFTIAAVAYLAAWLVVLALARPSSRVKLGEGTIAR